MMPSFSSRITAGGALGLILSASVTFAGTVAYWTFDEGRPGRDVSPLGREGPVRDVSGNGNHLRTSDSSTAPTYLGATPFPWTPATGEPNRLALHFTPNRHLFAAQEAINEQEFPEWTVEASFKVHVVAGRQVIVGKDGDPAGGPPPLAMAIAGPDGRLELGAVDGAGNWRTVSSPEPLEAGRWYSAAGVATADTMALWLKASGEGDYGLQGTASVRGAWYGGDGSWTVGRGMWNGEAAGWFDGVIDEVRASDVALEREDFLAAGETASRPEGVAAAPALVTGSGNGEPGGYLALNLELSAAFPGDPGAIFLEGSGDLETWESIPFEVEAIDAEGDSLRFNLVSEIAASDLATPHFLRGRAWPVAPHNPILPGADPDVLLVGDTVWIYPTYRSVDRRFFAFSSKDLVNWEIHGPILEYADIDWVPGNRFAWAPGVAEKDGKFYLYFSAGPSPSYIGVAVADSPAGPFVDSGEPLLFDNNDPDFEAIDAMVFTDPHSGDSFFYAGGSAGATLRVFELDETMTAFTREIDVETPPNFTEGPFVHYRDGIYFLSYSDGIWWDGSYEVHYATSETPYGPWDYRSVILESDENHRGPGHHSILYNPAADDWYIIYHRWNDETGPGPYGGRRKVAIDRLEYDEDGLMKPVIMTDTGVGPVRLESLSGEE